MLLSADHTKYGLQSKPHPTCMCRCRRSAEMPVAYLAGMDAG